MCSSLIAIMLGHLQMSLKECKRAYMALSGSAFKQENMVLPFVERVEVIFGIRTAPLEAAIQNILTDALGAAKEDPMQVLLKEDNDHSKVSCKV
jgi:hypothetical protein